MSFFNVQPCDIESAPELAHFGLVVHLAKKIYARSIIASRCISLEDLIITGYFGLRCAWRLYDPNFVNDRNEKTTFSKYASKVIVNFMSRDLNHSEFKIPRSIWVEASKVQAGMEISKWFNERMKLHPKQKKLLDQAVKCLNMNRRHLSNVTNDACYRIDFDKFEDRDKIRKAIEILEGNEDKRLAHVIRRYYGFDDGSPNTLKEIGEQLKCTKQYVQILRDKALKLIREKL